MADVNVAAKKPWGLIKPESGELEIRIGKHGAYKVEDETGAEDAVTGRIYVLKLDIEQTAVGNDSKPNSLTLKLTSDSAPGGTAQWSSQPAGISGNGNNVTFNPKKTCARQVHRHGSFWNCAWILRHVYRADQ